MTVKPVVGGASKSSLSVGVRYFFDGEVVFSLFLKKVTSTYGDSRVFSMK
jgi:hypothetical protein